MTLHKVISNLVKLRPWSFLATAILAAAFWTLPVSAQDAQPDPNTTEKTAAQERKDAHKNGPVAGPQQPAPATVGNSRTPGVTPGQGRDGDPNHQPGWRNTQPGGAPSDNQPASPNNPRERGPGADHGQKVGIPERTDKPSLQDNQGTPWNSRANDRSNSQGRRVGLPERTDSNKQAYVEPLPNNRGHQTYQPSQPADNAGQNQQNRHRVAPLPVERTDHAASPTQKQQPYNANTQPKPRPQIIEKSVRTSDRVRTLPADTGKPALRDATPTARIRTEQKTAWVQDIQTRIRQSNTHEAERRRLTPVNYTVRKPDGTSIRPDAFDRDHNRVIDTHFRRIRHHFGDPCFGFTFMPRSVSAFSAGFWLGYEEGFNSGYFTGLHFGSSSHYYRTPIFISFYYPYYYDSPFFTGFWHNGYYPSIYCYYGWVPRWVRPSSIFAYQIDPYPYSYSRPIYYLERPQVDEYGITEALRDIQSAWLDANIDLIGNYLPNDEKISVYFDNEYSYSISGNDYYEMTLDAMSTIKTVSMDFDDPIWINANEVFFTGRHVFYNPDNERQTVYVSYRLHRYGGSWTIIAVGSSPRPIKTDNLRDFRYD